MTIESSPKRYDIAIVSDFRYPGGTSSCIAQEITAQARAGYTTALIHLPSSRLSRSRPFNAQITACVRDGRAELVPPNASIRTRLALLHHPDVFAESPKLQPRIDADRALLIVHRPPHDRAGETYYSVESIAAVAESVAGGEVTWAPVGPDVRAALIETGTSIRITDADWHNLIDVDHWSIERSGFIGEIPVIGRHGRPDLRKWPETAEDLLAAYPDDGSVQVRILGGGEQAERILGRKPRHWTIHPFDAMSPRTFLSGIDFFIYYHHPNLIEAFGRTILEAIAAGVPAIVAPHFRGLFGDACVYAEARDAMERVWELYRNPEAYRAQVERGRASIQEHFGIELHERRIAKLIGPPSGSPTRRARRVPPERSVLFVASNGAGMGHITRILALARRAPETIRPVIATMSTGMRVARTFGFHCEFLPRRPEWGSSAWHVLVAERLVDLIEQHQVRTVVFDGNAPYQGVLAARERTGATVIWMRRAMWKAGAGEKFMERGKAFDLILEPGEYAAENDEGITVSERSRAACVNPILLLDEDELLPREDAKRELGLDPAKRAVLVQFGAGNVNDAASGTGMTARRLASEPDTEVVVAEWIIADEAFDLPDGVHRLRVYPISRYLRAFDFVISAAGYNSFHDLIAYAVPTILVPMETATENQRGRTSYADKHGAAIELWPFSEESLESALERMNDPQIRRRLSERCHATFPGNGAQEAMDLITRVNAEAWSDAPTPHTVAETVSQPETTEALA